MKNIQKRDSIIPGVLFFGVLIGYCLLAGVSLFIPLLVMIYAFHLLVIRGADKKRLMHVGLLLAVVAFAASVIKMDGRVSPYYTPVASISMLAMLLFSELPLAFSMSLIASALVSLIAETGSDHLLVLFVGSLVGAYAVRDTRTRGKILVAGLFVGLFQVLGYFLFHPLIDMHACKHALKPLFLNGLISAMFVLATLKIFEYLFGELTAFSLLELSDSLNQPLLKRLAFEAPGTYHHSLVLSNIAGAAADQIRANQLLTRVGAYYHDIGKLVKPEYFTENQMMTDNKHDLLEPSISRLVILNHVKEGVEIAQKAGLNPKIIDFIEQHHGTSVIHYFYQKALETDNEEGVEEETYRYPGPKPQTKEVAIVMLADAVEAATRSLEEHTPTKIEEVVRRVVNNKFIDGQLDECSLTLREIEKIGSGFSRALSAMYHVRVKYSSATKKTNGH